MKAVIFDMDGVLIDSEPFHQTAEIEAMKQHGYPITHEELLPYAGASRQAFMEGFNKKFNADIDWDSVFTTKDELFFELMNEVQPLNGVMDLVDSLKSSGLKLGLATSSQPRNLYFAADRFGYHSRFDAMVCAADITKSKPDPQIFLICADRMNVEPQDCAVFEDSLNGLNAANAAGMYSIGVTGTFPREELTIADKVIDSFSEITADEVAQLELSSPA